MRKSTSGFTIVELLIVIVVIAILAAISIIAYSGVQNRAYDSAVQNDLSRLKKAFEVYAVDNTVFYPDSNTLAANNVYNFYATKNSYMISSVVTSNLILCRNASANDYVIVAISKSGNKFYVSKAESGIRQYTGSWAGEDTINPMCTSDFSVSFSTNVRGYAANDGVNGPWRAWAGGN